MPFDIESTIARFIFPLRSTSTKTTRTKQGTREDRKTTSNALPHAHQPGTPGMRVFGIGDADRNPLYGSARIRRQA